MHYTPEEEDRVRAEIDAAKAKRSSASAPSETACQPRSLALAPCSAFMCARCGTREKMKTSPWCGYCWHIETTAPDEEDDVRPVPPGCTEAPGYILEIAGSVWLREDGSTTDVWAERGIWPTAASAREALGRFLSPNTEMTDANRTEK